MASRCLGPHYREDLLRAFFTDFLYVASPFCVFGVAAGSPPSLRDRDLLRPHRSPYCLRARSAGKSTEKCPRFLAVSPHFALDICRRDPDTTPRRLHRFQKTAPARRLHWHKSLQAAGWYWKTPALRSLPTQARKVSH